MRMLAGGLFAFTLAWLAVPAPGLAAAGSCSDLAKMALPHATITVAASVQRERSRPTRRVKRETSPRCPPSAASPPR